MRTIEHLIHTNVICVTAEMPLVRATELLLHSDVPELFVISATGQLLGILPDYALLRSVLVEQIDQATVGQHVCCITSFCTPTTRIVEAAMLLKWNVHARLPVIARGRLVGVITRATVLRSLILERQETESLSVPEVHVPRPQFLEFPTGGAAAIKKTNRNEQCSTEPESHP